MKHTAIAPRLLGLAALVALTACGSLRHPDLSPANLTMNFGPSTETLASGVTITHTRIGTGASPTLQDDVRLHYRALLPDGKEFDSTYRRGGPGSYALTRVIPCWEQALPRLKVGEQARLNCPAATAYGAKGVPGLVPPNADLRFDVELVAIER